MVLSPFIYSSGGKISKNEHFFVGHIPVNYPYSELKTN
jgi:hypothetical protein